MTPSQKLILLSGGAPSLNLDFLSGAIDPRITFTRASSGWYFDSSGTLASASTDTPRFSYDPATLAPLGLLLEEARTNNVRNNSMTGAVVGTPGTVPTGWLISNATVTTSVVAFGTQNGIPYCDIRLVGTTGNTNTGIRVEGNVAVTLGQTWSTSMYLAIVAGSTTNITSTVVRLQGRTTGSVTTADNFLSANVPLTSTLTRYSVSGTVADATTANVLPQVLLSFSSGVAIDITLRIGAPQLEQGAFVTSPILTTTVAVTRAVDTATMPVGSLIGPAFSVEIEEMQDTINGAANAPYVIDDGSVANSVAQYNNASGTTTVQTIVASGAAVEAVVSGSLVAGAAYKKAASFRDARQAGIFNAGSVATAAASPIPSSLTTIRFGKLADGTAKFSGYLRKLKIWRRSIADEEIQRATG